MNNFAMKNGIILLGTKAFNTLLALTEEEKQKGVMFMDPVPIMSFVFSSPRYNKFWMKNCSLPIDMIFCYKGKVIDIKKGEPHSEEAIGPNHPTDLIVEAPYGFCKTHCISIGDEIILK